MKTISIITLLIIISFPAYSEDMYCTILGDTKTCENSEVICYIGDEVSCKSKKIKPYCDMLKKVMDMGQVLNFDDRYQIKKLCNFTDKR